MRRFVLTWDQQIRATVSKSFREQYSNMDAVKRKAHTLLKDDRVKRITLETYDSEDDRIGKPTVIRQPEPWTEAKVYNNPEFI